MLEKAFELVEVAVGVGRKRAGSASIPSARAIVCERDLELVAKALHAPLHPHQLAALEAPGEQVGVAKRAREDRARAVAQLDRQVGRAGSRDLAFLADAREHAVDLLLGAQGRDLALVRSECARAA